jgi:NarL family two-component system response regulator LiaR
MPYVTSQPPIRVLIVDDHYIVRQGLEALLGTMSDIEVVGTASDGADGVELCRRHVPDVVLMDLVMPGMSGVEAIRLIKKQNPSVRIIALTSYDSEQLIEQVMSAGAAGYLMKYISGHELSKAIYSVMRDIPVLSPEAARVLIRNNMKLPSPGSDLTDREHEVLQLVVDGLNNEQIARRLIISPYTVKNHVRSILTKLNVDTRTEAAIYAMRHNIVERHG